MPNRRDFIRQTAAASGLLALPRAREAGAANSAARPLRLLMLGGTGNMGPRFVDAALKRGHRISVFVWTREKDKAQLPAGVERLLGDRNGDLESIKNRDWDAVVDLATYGPIWVRTLGEAIKDRVRHYTFISTNAVYDPAAYDKAAETSSVLTYESSEDPYTLTSPKGLREYGALKALCEKEAERQFPGRTLVFRPGWITGPGNQSFVSFAYWPTRMQRGGEVLAAGDPSTPVQFVDVRDLAEWSIRMIERSATGIYNVLGPTVPTTLGQLIEAARGNAATSAKLTWVPSAWLAARPDREMWSNVLFWTLESEGFAGMMRMNIERALAAGFTTRPVGVTLADVFDWHQQQPVERRAKLLTERRKKADGSGFEPVPVPWPVYLEREQNVLAAWHAQSTQS